MPAVKISTKHQITSPKEVFSTLNLEVGDFFDTHIHRQFSMRWMPTVRLPKKIHCRF